MTDKQYDEEMKALKELMPELLVRAAIGIILIAITYMIFNWL